MRRLLDALCGAIRDVLDLATPPACAWCRRPLAHPRPLCAACDARLPRLASGLCPACQERGAGPAGGPCAGCRERPGPLSACLAAVRFEGEVAASVRLLKYAAGGLRGLDPGPERVVAALACEAARRLPGGAPDAVLGVPIHPRRLRRRGIHVAGLLADAVARELGVPWARSALERRRDTPSQTGLAFEERRRNVAGAFAADPRRIRGARLVLVDDVVTTGATLGEAARTLRAAGARDVAAVCAARTPAP